MRIYACTFIVPPYNYSFLQLPVHITYTQINKLKFSYFYIQQRSMNNNIEDVNLNPPSVNYQPQLHYEPPSFSSARKFCGCFHATPPTIIFLGNIDWQSFSSLDCCINLYFFRYLLIRLRIVIPSIGRTICHFLF